MEYDVAMDLAAKRLPNCVRSRRGPAATAVVLAMGGFRSLEEGWPEWTETDRGVLLEMLSRRRVPRAELLPAVNRLLPAVARQMGEPVPGPVRNGYLGVLIHRIRGHFEELVRHELAAPSRVSEG